MRKVIAFCGNQGSGKDYSAKRLMMTKGFKVAAYANALRDIAFKTLGMSYEEGMNNYDDLKKNKIFGDLTFRNILENLGSAVRDYDKDFWARTVLKFISECTDHVAISDLRYPNEYWTLKEYCEANDISFKLVFCDFKSDRYDGENPHESAKLARYLKGLGYKDQEYVKEEDIIEFEGRNI